MTGGLISIVVLTAVGLAAEEVTPMVAPDVTSTPVNVASTPVPRATVTVAATPAPQQTPPAPILTASPIPPIGLAAGSVLSFYVCSGAPPGYSDGFCGMMAGGKVVYAGVVACGYAYVIGDQITIDGDPYGRVWTCADRGRLAWSQVDVWFATYAEGRAWRDQLPVFPVVRLVQVNC